MGLFSQLISQSQKNLRKISSKIHTAKHGKLLLRLAKITQPELSSHFSDRDNGRWKDAFEQTANTFFFASDMSWPAFGQALCSRTRSDNGYQPSFPTRLPQQVITGPAELVWESEVGQTEHCFLCWEVSTHQWRLSQTTCGRTSEKWLKKGLQRVMWVSLKVTNLCICEYLTVKICKGSRPWISFPSEEQYLQRVSC